MQSLFSWIKSDNLSAAGHVLVPRWVVYVQALLLGVVSITCFIFGLAASQLSRTSPNPGQPRFDSIISGTVVFIERGNRKPDSGSVVVLLPEQRGPAEQVDPATLNPSTFRPLNNAAISAINQVGGAVSRTDQAGKFSVTVDGPARYTLIVISNNVNEPLRDLDADHTARLARYFMPIDALYGEHGVRMLTVDARRGSVNVGELEFAN